MGVNVFRRILKHRLYSGPHGGLRECQGLREDLGRTGHSVFAQRVSLRRHHWRLAVASPQGHTLREWRQDVAFEEAGLGQPQVGWSMDGTSHACWEEGQMWQNLALYLEKLQVCRDGLSWCVIRHP